MRRSSFVVLIAVAAGLLLGGCSSNEAAKQKFLASGDRFVAQKKYKEAIVQYRNALQKDPRFAEARLKLAKAYEQVSDPANALREFVRSADLMPNDDEVQLKAGSYLFLARQFEDARARAQKVLDRSPRNVAARILLGNTLAGLKDLDAALTEMEEASKLDPALAAPQTNIGYLELARGRKAEAEQAFKQAIDADAKSIDARLALANFYLADARMEDAEQTLKEALALKPGDTLANRAMAAFYLTQKRSPEAEPFLKAAAESGDDAESKLELADYYARSNRDADAIGVLTPLLKVETAFADAAVRLADIDARQGHKDAAYARLADLLKREPRHARALTLRGRLRLGDKKTAEAIADFKAATAADPLFTTPHFMLAGAYEATNTPDAAMAEYEAILKITPSSDRAAFGLARLALASGKAEVAVQYAQQAVTARPDNVEARLVFARALAMHGEANRSVSELQTLTQQYPDNADARAALGTLMLSGGNFADARRWFDAALALDPQNVEASTGLVNVDLGTKRTAEARERLDARMAQAPVNPALSVIAAATYARMGDNRRAEEVLLQTIQADPSRLPPYVLLGRLYLSENRLDEARTQFETLLARDPKSIGAATMLGIILEQQHKPADAQKMYEQALGIQPSAPVAANNLAWMYSNNGANLDIALQLAQTAKSRLPDEPEVNDTLGWIYYKKNMPEQAIPALQQSVERAPKNAEFQFHLGLAYAKAGNTKAARTALEAALQINPAFAGADEARRVLATL